MNYKRGNPKFKRRIALRAARIAATAICKGVTLKFNNRTAEEINNGECFEWATIVFELLEGSKIAGHNIRGIGHSWIEYKGLCYDAEVPQGVRSWLALPFWERIKAEADPAWFNQAVKELR